MRLLVVVVVVRGVAGLVLCLGDDLCAYFFEAAEDGGVFSGRLTAYDWRDRDPGFA